MCEELFRRKAGESFMEDGGPFPSGEKVKTGGLAPRSSDDILESSLLCRDNEREGRGK